MSRIDICDIMLTKQDLNFIVLTSHASPYAKMSVYFLQF